MMGDGKAQVAPDDEYEPVSGLDKQSIERDQQIQVQSPQGILHGNAWNDGIQLSIYLGQTYRAASDPMSIPDRGSICSSLPHPS